MKPYKDDVGKWTIGVGHLIGDGSLEAKKARDKARAKKGLSSTLSPEEALSLFNQDVSERIPRVEEKFKELWPTMSTGLKAALVDIEYRGDMESKGEGEFGWVELLRKGKYKEASLKYLDHKEYKKRLKKNPKGDGVVKRMKRNARIIAAEEPADKLASS
jgi:GH24 family phage-related lysozyme (muramidase)